MDGLHKADRRTSYFISKRYFLCLCILSLTKEILTLIQNLGSTKRA